MFWLLLLLSVLTVGVILAILMRGAWLRLLDEDDAHEGDDHAR